MMYIVNYFVNFNNFYFTVLLYIDAIKYNYQHSFWILIIMALIQGIDKEWTWFWPE